ncbi:MAG: hypothetical protein QNJ41_10365 [Xenococcaceae cyanobacterium MO_188.B32]|nr:hypothetical protein [Xenococcaceae cyanobacterium MO_188.B32]
MGSPEAQAGDIEINTLENIEIKDGSFISNDISLGGFGNTGAIALNSNSGMVQIRVTQK